MKFIRKA